MYIALGAFAGVLAGLLGIAAASIVTAPGWHTACRLTGFCAAADRDGDQDVAEPVLMQHVRREIMECRIGCASCCIAPSISSAIPGMPGGKPAGVRCLQLTPDNRCRIFGRPERPAVCGNLRPNKEMCGAGNAEALEILAEWERLTQQEVNP